MKVEESTKGFKPFNMVITVESAEELCNLWHRFNIADDDVKELASKTCPFYDINHGESLWEFMDNKRMEFGI